MHDAIAALGEDYAVLTVDGRDYQLHKLSLADLKDLQRWVDTQFKDPVATIAPHLSGFPIEVAKFMARDSRDAACRPKPRLGMTEANLLMVSVDGLIEILYLSIRKGEPTFDRAELDLLCQKLTYDEVYGVIDRTGLLSRPDESGTEVPKA